jgi:uncharacterized protein (DUF1015 family)
MAVEEKAKRLATRKLRIVHNELASILAFANNYTNEVNNVNEVRIRIEALSEIAERFEVHQTDTEEFEEKGDEDAIRERVDFKNKLYEIKASLLQIIEDKQYESSPSMSSSSKNNPGCSMKLPAIHAPKFSVIGKGGHHSLTHSMQCFIIIVVLLQCNDCII